MEPHEQANDVRTTLTMDRTRQRMQCRLRVNRSTLAWDGKCLKYP